MPEQCILYVVSGAVIGMESCESYLSIICQTIRKKKKKPPVQIQMQAGHAATHKYHCIRDLCHSVARIHTLWLEFIPSVGRIHINAGVHTPDALLLTKASRTVCFWSKILLLRGPIASGEESPSLI